MVGVACARAIDVGGEGDPPARPPPRPRGEFDRSARSPPRSSWHRVEQRAEQPRPVACRGDLARRAARRRGRWSRRSTAAPPCASSAAPAARGIERPVVHLPRSDCAPPPRRRPRALVACAASPARRLVARHERPHAASSVARRDGAQRRCSSRPLRPRDDERLPPASDAVARSPAHDAEVVLAAARGAGRAGPPRRPFSRAAASGARARVAPRRRRRPSSARLAGGAHVRPASPARPATRRRRAPRRSRRRCARSSDGARARASRSASAAAPGAFRNRAPTPVYRSGSARPRASEAGGAARSVSARGRWAGRPALGGGGASEADGGAAVKFPAPCAVAPRGQRRGGAREPRGGIAREQRLARARASRGRRRGGTGGWSRRSARAPRGNAALHLLRQLAHARAVATAPGGAARAAPRAAGGAPSARAPARDRARPPVRLGAISSASARALVRDGVQVVPPPPRAAWRRGRVARRAPERARPARARRATSGARVAVAPSRGAADAGDGARARWRGAR